MATKAVQESVAPDEPGGEVYLIDGEERRVPRHIESAGRSAIQQWLDAQSSKSPQKPVSPAPAKPAATTDSPAEG